MTLRRHSGGSAQQRLAMQRELLVATATLQRLQVARALAAPALRLSAGWRVARRVGRLLGALAPRTLRWVVLGRLLLFARDFLSRSRGQPETGHAD